jgi:hypothetical protein
MPAFVKVSILAAVVVCCAAPVWSHGFEDCTKEAKENWQPQAEAEAAAAAAGYTVSKSAVEGTCYAVYAEKDGKHVELFYNPVDLQLAETHGSE